jgi:hypothetical protein
VVTVELDRRQVLDHWVHAQELDRRVSRPSDLAVADLGIQDTPPGAARQALAARLADHVDLSDEALFDGPDPLVLVWSHRGAPHLHRADDLVGLARALWPWSEADAKARLGRGAKRLADAGIGLTEGLALTAEAWHAALSGAGPDGMTKGEASAAVSERLPDGVPEWCRGCQSTHVNDLLFRLGALPGGARMTPGRSPLRFQAIDGWAGAPDRAAGTERLVTAYLRLLGPANPSEAGSFLGTSATAMKSAALAPAWPDGLVEVTVQGRRSWLPEAEVDAVRGAPPADGVRLVAASDPYLQTRDRDLLMPERAHQKALWRILGSPGAILVAGEVAGIWRARQVRGAGGTLEIVAEPFARLPARLRAPLEGEAQRLATLRGLASSNVVIDA